MSSTAALSKRLLSLNAVIGVRKPTGESSAKTVERVKNMLLSPLRNALPPREFKQLSRRLKVGHGGTLDPLASGVLVIGIGEGCKAMHTYLHSTVKVYQADGLFGVEHDTYDRTGVVTRSDLPSSHITKDAVEAMLKERFTGEIMQKPPIFSALRINGVRAYEIARKRQRESAQTTIEAAEQDDASDEGKKRKTDAEIKENKEETQPTTTEAPDDKPPVELAERKITIHKIELVSMEGPAFTIRMECSSGTYVRSLLFDLGRALESGATMMELARLQQGPIHLDDCLDVEQLTDIDLILSISLLDKK